MFLGKMKCARYRQQLSHAGLQSGSKEIGREQSPLMTRIARKSTQFFSASLIILGLGVNSFQPSLADAQQRGAIATESSILGSRFIPGDAVLVGEVKIAATLASPQMEMYPVEVIDAWASQYLGLTAKQLESLRLVVSAPGTAEPQFGMVLTASQGMQLGKAGSDLFDLQSPIRVNQHECYPVVDAPGVVVHQLDAKTLIIATEDYIDAILRASKQTSGRGVLAKLADSTSVRGTATVVASVEPIRPLAIGMTQAMAPQIPPPLQPFTDLPVLLDAVLLGFDMEDSDGTVEISLQATDESSATKLNGLITNGLEIGRQIALSEMVSELDPNDPMANAMLKYLERISGLLVSSVSPRQEGERLTLKISPSQGMATQGVLMGLLLPAVQSARQSARMMTSMNNLKQIGLAMHNSHDVYRKFPGDILAPDGTPLLSWRVAILPYIEQYELYKQFNKDEPWNSPHNLKLMEKMPDVYVHPVMQAGANRTVYQRPLGPKFIFEGHEGIAMRNILDGLSNTVMVIETETEAAVEWTKPADCKVDLSDVVGSTAGWTRDGFNVLIADGSVRYVPSSIDAKTLKALFTRNGAEVIEDF